MSFFFKVEKDNLKGEQVRDNYQTSEFVGRSALVMSLWKFRWKFYPVAM